MKTDPRPPMSNRTILISGCSSGIGLAAAATLKARGWRVLATARKPEDLARLEKDYGLEAFAMELSDLASINACADAVLERTHAKLDALYNNAAYGVIGAMEDISGDVLRKHLDVNVVGTHELTRRIIPAMRAQGHGRIVTCSSVLGLVSGPYRGPYCASKYAVEAMTDALRYELKSSGIHVSLLEPGPIKTQFLPSTLATFKSTVDVANSPHKAAYAKRIAAMENDTGSKLKLGPEAVVKKLIHALESPNPKARYMVSPHTYIAATLKRVLPGRVLDMILSRS
jgi:NAD(P)-dependent dehydrogenase (short-subunit alcohol dehydrogenase family)